MTRTAISTDTAPQAIGAYSQAIRAGNTVYLSGQIPLDPVSMTLVSTDIEPQIEQVFRTVDVAKVNLEYVIENSPVKGGAKVADAMLARMVERWPDKT